MMAMIWDLQLAEVEEIKQLVIQDPNTIKEVSKDLLEDITNALDSFNQQN